MYSFYINSGPGVLSMTSLTEHTESAVTLATHVTTSLSNQCSQIPQDSGIMFPEHL